MQRRGIALLPLGLAVLAIAEIAVFISVVHLIGGAWTLLALAVGEIAGMLLLRREGIKGWRAFRAAAAEGRPPGAQVANSLAGLAGALLLAIPGFITSVAGLLLLIGRPVARKTIERYTERRVGAAVAGDLFGPRRVKVRRGEPVVVVEHDDTPVHAPSVPAAAIEGEVVEGEVIR
ncbi:FxsA family protein [Paractinoplanes durhamensis]|uniref:Membrane protein n=2 Tax=Paractinoplanes durhamensis TaxID=113563 RepID=A0ABQ3YQW9_9ACTN|nr:FxsA family protein [Actinoplanes durhamensis]GID99973.1 membrane protein [Actinoplanes durhamensis]